MKNPPEQTKEILSNSLIDFAQELVDHAADGWQLDEDNMPYTHGFMFVAHIWRNPTEEQRNAQPKLSRAEILAKARQAKADKAAAEKAAAEAAVDAPTEQTPPAPTDDAPY